MCGSVRIKEQTPQRHTSKRDWTTSSIYNNYYTLTIEHNREGLCMYILNQQTCTSNELNNVGEIRFSILFILMFVVDFPMQHKFCFVNLTSRSCRTWKSNQITSTYLKEDLHFKIWHRNRILSRCHVIITKTKLKIFFLSSNNYKSLPTCVEYWILIGIIGAHSPIFVEYMSLLGLLISTSLPMRNHLIEGMCVLSGNSSYFWMRKYKWYTASL